LSRGQRAKGIASEVRNEVSVLCVLLITLCPMFCAPFCYAAPHEEYKKIQKEIKTQKQKLEEVKKRESSVLTEIELTSRQMKAAEYELQKNRNKLTNTEARIAKVESEISHNKGNIERHREWMKRKLRAIFKYGNQPDSVMLFMGTDDISQLMRSSKYLQYITLYERKLLESYKDTLAGLSEKEKQLVALKRDLVKNRETVRAEEASLADKKTKKEMLLASVKREKVSSAKMLRELENASKKILEIIRDSEKAEKQKEVPFSGKGFPGLKGKLPWPVEGKVAIPYGSQKDPQFSTPIFRSGTYIQANDNAYAKAVYGGKVVFAEWFKGYGQLVIVNHGEGYHTLYGSLSEIFTKVGDIIKGRQAVGKVGNSGILNTPGLYFEVRYKGKPLDPLQWLQRR
jgi:septal ring factor EnvC (AmiA/AmiB activator)